jgi:hypothetical protein
MTHERLLVQMRSDHATDNSRLGVTIVVTAAESYDVQVGGVVLYLMGFQMDLLDENNDLSTWLAIRGWTDEPSAYEIYFWGSTRRVSPRGVGISYWF